MSTRFGPYLREQRLKAELSQKVLAKMLGISAPYLSDVERGKNDPLSLERMEQCAAILRIDVRELQVRAEISRGRVSLSDKISEEKALEFAKLSLGLVSSVTFSIEDTVGDAVEQLEAALQHATELEALRQAVKNVATNLRQAVLTQHDSGPPDDDEINRLRSLEE